MGKTLNILLVPLLVAPLSHVVVVMMVGLCLVKTHPLLPLLLPTTIQLLLLSYLFGTSLFESPYFWSLK